MNSAAKKRTTKIFAIAAAACVAGVGITGTLAAWTDTEWIFVGVLGEDGPGGPGEPPVGTSTFEVLQNVGDPTDDGAWTNDLAAPGGALTFSANAADLTPGDASYARVALKTDTDSVAGDVNIATVLDLGDAAQRAAAGVTPDAADIPADGDAADLLWDVLEVRVATSATAFATCDATAFTAGNTIIDGPLADATTTATQALDAEGGSTQYYCFEISFPEAGDVALPAGATLDDYMGLGVVPTWKFAGVSS